MSQPTILILEDVAFDVEIIQAVLHREGVAAEYICVDNQQQFVEALAEQPIDLVLADVSLPGFDGRTALDIVRSTGRDIPFIWVSGVIGEEMAIETLKDGVTDYVLKQQMNRLVPTVRRALREQQERRNYVQTQAALKASQERFRASVETMLDCFSLARVVRDGAGAIATFRIEYLNSAACDAAGRRCDELQGGLLDSLFPQYRESGLRAAFCQVVEQGLPLMREVLIYSPSDPKQLELALDVHAAKLEDGLVITWRDITFRKRREKERETLLAEAQAARAEAEAASRIKDEFLATLSHELRTPLNAMQGWIQLLQRRRLDEAAVSRAFETIQRNADALKRLIEDVLDVSRIIRGKLKLNMVPTDLVPVIVAATETVLPALQSKQIHLHTHIDPDVRLVLGDRNRLQQVVWNLLSNAVKFTPEEGVIHIRLELVERFVRLQVQDSGRGIDPKFLPYIFERFRQADSSTTRAHTGLGLGLAIVRHLVELHGGQVWAESSGQGQGSTFTVVLPYLKPHINPPTTQAQLQSLMVGRNANLPALDGIRVLVVDDDADTRELFATVLGELGAAVGTVDSAEQARQLLPMFEPNVLVSDITMPGEDGYDLLRRLRDLPGWDALTLPAIALTAQATDAAQQQALAAGFQMHLPKPVEVQQLALAVAEQFRLAQAAQQQQGNDHPD